jgi:hypothetical protein
VLAASAPAHAISEGHADSEEHPRVGMLVADFDPDHAGVQPGCSAPRVSLTAHDTV